MLGLYGVSAGQMCSGSRHTGNSRAAAPRQRQALDRPREQLVRFTRSRERLPVRA
jgi:hypothetical protein